MRKALLQVHPLLAWTLAAATGKRLRVCKPSRRLAIGYAAVFMVYAVVRRNLPWPTFDRFYVANLV